MSFSTKSCMTALVVIITRLLALLPFLSRIVPCSPVSLVYALSPLVGFYGTTTHALCAYILHTGLSAYMHPLSLLSCITHVPTFCGTLFLTTDSRLLRASISALCIGGFLLHPVGYLCSYYIVYWIPALIIALLPRNSLFLQAVGSTMTTHAVGSVIWLYTHNTTPAFWGTLFYRVWAERLLFAALLVAGYYVILMIKTLLLSLYERENSCSTG